MSNVCFQVDIRQTVPSVGSGPTSELMHRAM